MLRAEKEALEWRVTQARRRGCLFTPSVSCRHMQGPTRRLTARLPAPQTLGLSLHALDDPPLGPPVVRAAPVVPAAYTAAAAYSAAPQPPPLQLPAALAAAHQAAPPAEDMAASLAAAKLRADAAEVSLRKAHFAAANLVAAATTRRSINATVAVSR